MKQKEAYYFSHDSNARHDPKIVKMLTKHKYGYQWYFMIIEILRDQSDFKYKKDAYCFNAIALELHETPEQVEHFIKDCINEFNLLREDDQFIWSDSLLNRMKIKTEKSKIYSKNALSRWRNSGNNSNAIAMQGSNAIVMHKRKGKESKVKEKKENINTMFDLPEQLHGKITKELWGEWVEYKQEIKKPLTANSIKKQVKFLLCQANPDECIESAMRNGWQGLFEVKANGVSQPSKNHNEPYPTFN